MKFLKTIILILAISVAGNVASGEVQPGVDASLARFRSANVSGIAYNLDFNIPEDIAQPVTGICNLRFDFAGNDTLYVDYANQEGEDITVTVNGSTALLKVINQHIAIPPALLRVHDNDVTIPFASADRSLNRHSDYLYTLFVPANARSAFPCFDQPDLKAQFTVSVTAPEEWKVASNGTLAAVNGSTRHFAQTQLIPTYLFSFIAGNFQQTDIECNGRKMTFYHRQTDPRRVAQLDEAADILDFATTWLESYTGISNPYPKYEYVILPGYQFGGMEHPGLIQFNENRVFLGDNPSPDQLKARFNLLCHETSHLWFGDMVTMRWFDDVWTKEVFANFLADKIMQQMYPGSDFNVEFMRNHYAPAYSVDRSPGTHAIQQQLDNLNKAGMLYGNIIYHKSPIMMQKLEQQMGETAMRRALQHYLSAYRYANATWDDLIAIMDSVAPDAGIAGFDNVWVKQPGMPVITASWTENQILVKQSDPLGRQLTWPQKFTVGILNGETNCIDTMHVDMSEPTASMEYPCRPEAIIPNLDGLGYGQFVMDIPDMQLVEKLSTSSRLSVATNIYENFRLARFDAATTFNTLSDMLSHERDKLVASSISKYLLSVVRGMEIPAQQAVEPQILAAALGHPLAAVRQSLMRGLMTTAYNHDVISRLYDIWDAQSDSLLNKKDYTEAAYHLAIIMPDHGESILATQRQRLSTPDEIDEFDYISRACTPDTTLHDSLFAGLRQPSNRINEPWAACMLSLLTDRCRADRALSYIEPGLDALDYIQQTSDIFFPQSWIGALLDNQTSAEANATVMRWVDAHPGLDHFLRNKILATLPFTKHKI